MADLTPKQELFVREYLIDLNATKAAIRAGYSEETAYSIGSENLTKPEVAEAIRAAFERRNKRLDISADRVVREIALLAFSDMRDFAEWGKDGVKLKPSSELSEDASRCVAEVSENTIRGERAVKFKLHDKINALDKLCRHLGIYKDSATLQINGKLDLTEMRMHLEGAISKLPEEMRIAIAERMMADAGK